MESRGSDKVSLPSTTGSKYLCVINIETTGLNFVNDEVLEIGLVKMDQSGVICGRFSSLVWPGEEVFSRSETSRALSFMKRQVSDFKYAPSPEEVANAVLAFIGDWKKTHLTSFNVQFVRGFLHRKAWGRIGKGYPWPISIIDQCSDIMGRARSPFCPWSDHYQSYKWPRLTDAAHYFKVQYDPRMVHSALPDAEVAARIYQKMIERGEIEDEP